MVRLISCIFVLVLASQYLYARQQSSHFYTHFGKREGLAANDAISFAQDDKGFMWIGTLNGLQRYDGTRFLTFKQSQNNTYKLPSNYIGPLFFDKQKRLWIVFGTGQIGFFDTKKFVYTDTKIVPKDSTAERVPRKVIEDNAGNLFLMTYQDGSLLAYDKITNTFSDSKEVIRTPPGWMVGNIYLDSTTRKLWLASDSGLAVYNTVTKKISYRGDNVENEPAITATKDLRLVRVVFADSKKRIWIKTWIRESPYYYVYSFSETANELTRYSLYDQVKSTHDVNGFLQTRNGSIWIRGYRVLAEFDEHEKKFKVELSGIINERGIEYEMINSIYEDREQNIWVATNNDGLYRFNPPAEFFHTVQHFTENGKTEGVNIFTSFITMRDGSILAATGGDGLYRYDNQFNNIPVNISGITESSTINSMMRTKDNRYILMTGRAGFYVYDELKNEARFYNPPAFDNGAINGIVEDNQGNFWIGVSYQGLFKCAFDSNKELKRESIIKLQGIGSTNFTEMIFDHEGNFWVATLGEGVYKIDPVANKILKRFTNIGPEDQKLPHFNVDCMLKVNDSVMLISAGYLTVYNFKTGKTRLFEWPEGETPEIASMIKDRSGKIWMGTLNGLYRVDLATKAIAFFDRNDGMVNDYMSIGVTHALPDGRLIFGTINSFFVFDPKKVEEKKDPVLPQYTSFTSANRSLLVDSLLQKEVIRLSPDENSIVIEFSDMSYRKDYKMSYMLENLDKDWRKSEGINQAVYSYIPPGSYVFKVRAEGEDGVIHESKPLHIKVNPPFYLSWWFYGLVVLVIASVLFWIDREKQAKRKAVELTRSQIANDLYHEINVTLNNIYMLSEMARIKADNNAPLSKEYIGQIHDKSKTMITAMDDILWSIKPENDNMEKFFRRMRELADALSHESEASVSISIAEKAKALRPNAKHKLLFYLIFKEALQAVILQAGGRETTIEIDMAKGDLLFRLHDPGALFDKNNPGIATSIKSIQERAAQLDADLDIEANHKGVSITLITPAQ